MKKRNGILSEVNNEDLKLLNTNPHKFWRGVTNIGEGAFYNCTNLTQINIPDSINSIGNGAFNGCLNLVQINIPKGVTSIGERAFKNCFSLAQIDIPEGITSIASSTFTNCTGLTQINIPESVTSIEQGAFLNCRNLTQISLPEGIVSIGREAFSCCKNLTQIDIPKSVVSIGFAAFTSCSNLTQIDIPESVTSIGKEAFLRCKNLENITLHEGNISIGEGAFKECTKLSQIAIPESVTIIGESAFENCIGLSQIAILEGVTDIGKNAFLGCKNLSQITIPKSVTSIKYGSFQGCSGLSQIIIPESVTRIESFAFQGCSGLSQITIPEGVTDIGNSAFDGCTNLTQINIPDNVTIIGDCAFKDCTNLSQITLPKNVTEILNNAFNGCTNLSQITIPKSVTSVGLNAFDNCDPNLVLTFSTEHGDVNINAIIFSKALNQKIKEVEKIGSSIQIKSFSTLVKKLNVTEENSHNLSELYKLSKMLGLLETEDKTINNGKSQVKVCDVAYTILQRIFITNEEFYFHELHANMSNLQNEEYNEAFLRFVSDKQNCADLLNNPSIIPQIYSWFKKRTEMNITGEVQEPSEIPTIEQNRFKVYNYSEMEDGHYKYKWNAPTVKLIMEELAKSVYSNVTPETREIAEYLAHFPEYKDDKFFDKAVEILNEFKELEKQGKVKKSLLNVPLKKDLVSAVEEYKQSTQKIINETEQNLTGTLANQADIADFIFTYELLPKDSLEVLGMGMMTSCCASLFGAGSGAQRATIIHPDLQWIVIRDIKGNIVAGGPLYVNRAKGYAVVNDVEVNIKYLGNPEQTQAIYDAFKKSIEAFVEQYNQENAVPITQVNCGISPNWEGIRKQIEQNPKGDILEGVDFSKYGYVGTGHWAGDWQREQYVIYSAKDNERSLK